eukprot:6155412-Amphidinium_carterae.1
MGAPEFCASLTLVHIVMQVVCHKLQRFSEWYGLGAMQGEGGEHISWSKECPDSSGQGLD